MQRQDIEKVNALINSIGLVVSQDELVPAVQRICRQGSSKRLSRGIVCIGPAVEESLRLKGGPAFALLGYCVVFLDIVPWLMYCRRYK